MYQNVNCFIQQSVMRGSDMPGTGHMGHRGKWGEKVIATFQGLEDLQTDQDRNVTVGGAEGWARP